MCFRKKEEEIPNTRIKKTWSTKSFFSPVCFRFPFHLYTAHILLLLLLFFFCMCSRALFLLLLFRSLALFCECDLYALTCSRSCGFAHYMLHHHHHHHHRHFKLTVTSELQNPYVAWIKTMWKRLYADYVGCSTATLNSADGVPLSAACSSSSKPFSIIRIERVNDKGRVRVFACMNEMVLLKSEHSNAVSQISSFIFHLNGPLIFSAETFFIVNVLLWLSTHLSACNR